MIEVQGLWKRYKLGNTVDFSRNFREVLTERMSISKRTKSIQDNQYFWALKDINLKIREGKSLGLIGHNGAGKSTLLKVLSRITKPTRGKIKIAGSLTSLLEVGTGFHPELSGRENIYLYGSIMGMSKNDISNRFDEIVSYAGIEKFIDTPVKRYSSGMYVRLAFSIAAHVEPDILIVDEVLAVGDKAFREKCLGKMDDVAQSGRTVIFVSHNMSAVASLCEEVAWLDGGQIKSQGETKYIIEQYENSFSSMSQSELATSLIKGPLRDQVKLKKIVVNKQSPSFKSFANSSEEIEIDLHWLPSSNFDNLAITLSLFHGESRVMTLDDLSDAKIVKDSPFISRFSIPRNTFISGELSIAAGVSNPVNNSWCWGESLSKINIIPDDQATDYNQSNLLSPIGKATRI